MMSIAEYTTLAEAAAVAGPREIRQVGDVFIVTTGSDMTLTAKQELLSADISRLLTDAEILAAIRLARTNDAVAVVLFKLATRHAINSASSEFAAAKSELVASGVITPARADIVFCA